MRDQFFKCGCRIVDVCSCHSIVEIRFSKCRKHRKEFKNCSYEFCQKIKEKK